MRTLKIKIKIICVRATVINIKACLYRNFFFWEFWAITKESLSLSVCLSMRFERNKERDEWKKCRKVGKYLYWCYVVCCVLFAVCSCCWWCVVDLLYDILIWSFLMSTCCGDLLFSFACWSYPSYNFSNQDSAQK